MIGTEKLKQCPFCGNDKPLFRNVLYDTTLWIIECSECRCEFTVRRTFEEGRKRSNRKAVAETWNRRYGG